MATSSSLTCSFVLLTQLFWAGRQCDKKDGIPHYSLESTYDLVIPESTFFGTDHQSPVSLFLTSSSAVQTSTSSTKINQKLSTKTRTVGLSTKEKIEIIPKSSHISLTHHTDTVSMQTPTSSTKINQKLSTKTRTVGLSTKETIEIIPKSSHFSLTHHTDTVAMQTPTSSNQINKQSSTTKRTVGSSMHVSSTHQIDTVASQSSQTTLQSPSLTQVFLSSSSTDNVLFSSLCNKHILPSSLSQVLCTVESTLSPTHYYLTNIQIRSLQTDISISIPTQDLISLSMHLISTMGIQKQPSTKTTTAATTTIVVSSVYHQEPRSIKIVGSSLEALTESQSWITYRTIPDSDFTMQSTHASPRATISAAVSPRGNTNLYIFN